MPIFAPVYRPAKQPLLALLQREQSKKRKRGQDSSDEDEVNDAASQISAESDPSRTQPTRAFHPVNKKDPYHVAGHSREEPLPLPPFPHAAIKEPSKKKIPIDEELAALNPPLYVPPAHRDDKSTSLKRRHLDNITTILHRCMLRGDWQRASRAWSLLLRTEIAGRGIDVRRNGRWGIGAEILMRGGTQQNQGIGNGVHEDVGEPSTRVPDHDAGLAATQSQFSDEGFKIARQYYERLILQYPHTPYTQHRVNALAIYPALFNIWVYEVQDRSNRARKQVASPESELVEGSDDSMHSDSVNLDQKRLFQQIRSEELEQALPIASRMDELLLSPPYDTSTSLLQLRSMVAMWTSALHTELADSADQSLNDSDRSSGTDIRQDSERHQAESRKSLQKAKKLFTRLHASDVQLPPEALALLAEDGD
jgi:hypothetical protein